MTALTLAGPRGTELMTEAAIHDLHQATHVAREVNLQANAARRQAPQASRRAVTPVRILRRPLAEQA